MHKLEWEEEQEDREGGGRWLEDMRSIEECWSCNKWIMRHWAKGLDLVRSKRGQAGARCEGSWQKKQTGDVEVRAATRCSNPIVSGASGEERTETWWTDCWCWVSCGAAVAEPWNPIKIACCWSRTQRWAGVKSKGKEKNNLAIKVLSC